MKMQTTLWLMLGVRFGPLFSESDGPAVHDLLSWAMEDLNPADTVIIGSAYGFDKVVMDYLSGLLEPPKIRVIAPYKGTTVTWPAKAASSFLGQVADTHAEEFWVAEQHQDGVYSKRDTFVLQEAVRAVLEEEVDLRATCLWPGNPGVLADTVRGAVSIGAVTTNLWPYLRKPHL